MTRLAAFALLISLSGCAPSLTPLYRDYADSQRGADGVKARIEQALLAAKWAVTEGVTDNVIATEPRVFRSWGIYVVEIELEVVPIANDHVRVLVHPYRKFFQGKRRKIPYLRKSLARSAIRDLTDAFEQYGLTYEGTAQQRDRANGVR